MARENGLMTVEEMISYNKTCEEEVVKVVNSFEARTGLGVRSVEVASSAGSSKIINFDIKVR